jgi:hypothetical protein
MNIYYKKRSPPKLMLLLARIFGKYIECNTIEGYVNGYVLDGVLYITKEGVSK